MKPKAVFQSIFLLPVLLFAAACSGNMFLASEPEDIEIMSIASGTVLVRGAAEIPATLVQNSEEKTISSLLIELVDSTGMIVATRVLTGEEISETLAPVSVEDVPAGLYEIRYAARDAAEAVLSEHSVQFFLVDEEIRIAGLSVYPPVFYPSGSGILVAAVDCPEGVDPFLRWSMGSTLLAEGLYSAGYGEIVWNTPKKEGVYTILVELFPMAPGDFGSFAFTSSISLEADLFVSSKQKLTKNEFIPADEYYSLFHFCGETNDSGYRTPQGTVSSFGSPRLSVEGDLFGYLIGAGSGFLVSEPILPSAPDTGVLLPFTLQIRMADMGAAGSGTLFTVASPSDDPFFLLTAADGTGFTAKLRWGTEEITSQMTDPLSGSVLSLSVVPDADSVSFLWYADGTILLSEDVPVSVPVVAPFSGSSRIGGDGEKTWLLDEFGIYARKTETGTSQHTDLFRNEMIGEYGTRLIIAEGFDGGIVPESVTLSETCVVGGGFLSIPETGSLSVSLSLPSEEATYELEFAGVTGSGSFVVLGATREYLSIPFSTGELPKSFSFALSLGSRDIVIDHASLLYSVQLAEGEESLSFEVRTAPESGAVAVGDLLAYVIDDRIVTVTGSSSAQSRRETGLSN